MPTYDEALIFGVVSTSGDVGGIDHAVAMDDVDVQAWFPVSSFTNQLEDMLLMRVGAGFIVIDSNDPFVVIEPLAGEPETRYIGPAHGPLKAQIGATHIHESRYVGPAHGAVGGVVQL